VAEREGVQRGRTLQTKKGIEGPRICLGKRSFREEAEEEKKRGTPGLRKGDGPTQKKLPSHGDGRVGKMRLKKTCLRAKEGEDLKVRLEGQGTE